MSLVLQMMLMFPIIYIGLWLIVVSIMFVERKIREQIDKENVDE